MSAYVPLAFTVFSNDHFGQTLYECLQTSLIDSRLFFNGHVVVPDTAFIRILNQTYMRAMYKRFACSRYDGTAKSHEEVRRRYNVSSVDCILQKNRLAYLARLILRQPKSLLTPLHAKRGTHMLSWTRLIVDDLSFLRSHTLP